MRRKISEETRKKIPNLSNIEGTITQIVQENSATISKLCDDYEVSDEDFKEYILELFEQAKQTRYVKQSIIKIERMQYKSDIASYIYNMNLAGSGDRVI